MTQIRWTAEAADQLRAIIDHIREDNPEIARVVAQTILAVLTNFSRFRQWADRENAKAPAS